MNNLKGGTFTIPVPSIGKRFEDIVIVVRKIGDVHLTRAYLFLHHEANSSLGN